jgi:hypothetical protein
VCHHSGWLNNEVELLLPLKMNSLYITKGKRKVILGTERRTEKEKYRNTEMKRIKIIVAILQPKGSKQEGIK